MDNNTRACENLKFMTQRQPEKQRKDLVNYSRPVLVIMLLICLCLAGFVFVESFSNFDFSSLLSNPLVLPAIFLQIVASLLFVLAWKILLAAQTQNRFSFAQCAAQIGITLLGKYLPGKIWGLVGRTYVLNNKGLSKSESLSLLLADQFITFYTGIMIGVVALCLYFSVGLAIPLAVLSLLAIPIIGNNYDKIIGWLKKFLGYWLNKISTSSEPQAVLVTRKIFVGCSIIYLLHWLATSTVLILLFYPLISNQLVLDGSLFIAAIPLAMLAGFLAIWAPGGVGVREAVIVGILLLSLPLDAGVAIALSYRLICILIDFCFGVFTLTYYSVTAPDMLKNKE